MSNLTKEQYAKYDEFSVSEKIAILLIQLGDDITDDIFNNFDVDSIAEIAKSIAQIKNIDKNITIAILDEFRSIAYSNENIDGLDDELLYKVLRTDEFKKILENLSQKIQKNQNFSYLSNIQSKQISELIKDEHPQVIALVLAHLDSNCAAEVLSFFSTTEKADIIVRMATSRDIPPAIVNRVSDLLENELKSVEESNINSIGIKPAANVLSCLDIQESKTTIEQIEKINNELAIKIKDLMFSFEDIVNLDNFTIKEILKNIPRKDLILALKLAPDELKQKFLLNMASGTREHFNNEMDFTGVLKLKDIEEAQKKIVDFVHNLNGNNQVFFDDFDDISKDLPKEVPTIEETQKEEISSMQNLQNNNDILEKLLIKSDGISDALVDLENKFDKFQTQREQQARDEGYKDGELKARLDFQNELEKEKDKIIKSALMLDETIEHLKSQISQLESKLSLIALEIAKEVIIKEVDNNSAKIAMLFSKELLQPMNMNMKFILKVNPLDFKYLSNVFMDKKNIKVESDDAIIKGGVMLISDNNSIYENVMSRYNILKQSILENFRD